MSSFFAAVALGPALPTLVRDAFRLDSGESRLISIGHHAVVRIPHADHRIALRESESGIVAWVGELVLQSTDRSRADPKEHGLALAEVSDPFLRQCAGTFALLSISATESSAAFATDSLGVRNLYWAIQDEVIFVSTSLESLASFNHLRLSIDLRGVYETVAFGYPLGERTVYAEIRCLPEAGVLRLVGGDASVVRYRDLAETPEVNVPIVESAERLSAEFLRAVSDRSPGAHAVLGLSGGMDSRFLAWTLQRLGAAVTAINVSPEGSQDRVYAHRAAEAMGLEYFQYQPSPGPVNVPATLDRMLRVGSLSRTGDLVARRVWSGDGGSVGLGAVHVHPEVLVSLARGDTALASDQYLRAARLGVPARILRKELRGAAASWLSGAFRIELERFVARGDPRRALHLALLANDQRRHCSALWEQIHHLALDQTYPFFDARFIDAICATPLDQLVLHRVYNEILIRCEGANITPWQTYPNHVPCSIAGEDGLSYQWSAVGATYKRARNDQLGRVRATLSALRSGAIPANLIDIPALLACCAAQTAGVRDFSTHLDMVLLLSDLSHRTQGRIGFSP